MYKQGNYRASKEKEDRRENKGTERESKSEETK
jgi:hypothetical protein